jgi:hypothetical protein
VEDVRHERRGLLMPSRLAPRLARLEARRPPMADPPSMPPEPPPAWCEEVLRLLRDSGIWTTPYAPGA